MHNYVIASLFLLMVFVPGIVAAVAARNREPRIRLAVASGVPVRQKDLEAQHVIDAMTIGGRRGQKHAPPVVVASAALHEQIELPLVQQIEAAEIEPAQTEAAPIGDFALAAPFIAAEQSGAELAPAAIAAPGTDPRHAWQEVAFTQPSPPPAFEGAIAHPAAFSPGHVPGRQEVQPPFAPQPAPMYGQPQIAFVPYPVLMAPPWGMPFFYPQQMFGSPFFAAFGQGYPQQMPYGYAAAPGMQHPAHAYAQPQPQYGYAQPPVQPVHQEQYAAAEPSQRQPVRVPPQRDPYPLENGRREHRASRRA